MIRKHNSLFNPYSLGLLFSFLITGCSPKYARDMAFIPFVKTSSAGSPCIDVEIEGQRLSLELDLGLQGDLSLHTNVLDKVQGKSLEETKMFIGFRGDPYSKNLYRLPCLKIENFSFENRILQEHDDAFEEQSLFFPEESHTQEPGRIGWKLFAGYLLLLDLPANHMILAKSYADLHRLLNGDFIELPLTLEEGLIGLHLKDEKGEIIHCFLDTGSTDNDLRNLDLL